VSEQLVLAIDTTGEFGSLALGTPDGVIEEVLMHSPDGYGHVLFEWIEVLLQGTASGWAISRCSRRQLDPVRLRVSGLD
jgi:hypothetical protein